MGGEVPDGRRRAGELVVELGRKLAEFGPEALRVVTVEEAERERVDWFRLGWEEHARLVSGESAEARPGPIHDEPDEPGMPPGAPVPRLRVAENGDATDEGATDEGAVDDSAHDRAPDATRSDRGERAEGEHADGEAGAGHGGRSEDRDEFPLPVVGAAEAEVRELMPHRIRSRGRHRP
ncbi:hypothetical protein [Streptomyces endophyticus]|uniref:Uncharacterized protein n=1 Tax=Streptomyces endophyticus TaxID=714166 RepID=A0ABU6FJF0_9ACTN|nr:hypothetical protein [Streptomyces endophyticus]MEB8344073.1 hypothetical protein [Streptomyces endophyticus]